MPQIDILSNKKFNSSNFKSKDFVNILLENRGIKTEKEKKEFLNSDISKVSIKSLGIDSKQIDKTLLRIKEVIKNRDKIVIYGDYDVDGVTATAILWETLRDIGADVMPYIPHRVKHGYGLSEKGIEDMLSQFPKAKLIFTVDNGIVANDAVDFAKEKGLEVVITDHHLPGKSLPSAFSIIHTTQICGAGVAYFLSSEIKRKFDYVGSDNHLELVALATVADLMPLLGPNRALLKKGLEELRDTKRIGLIEIINESQIVKDKIDTYEIGHIIGPRINAMGRLEYAMDSLRLICTNNPTRARELAKKLGSTNKDRQKLTFDTLIHAKELVGKSSKNKVIIISHESYDEGIIGLVAGRLTEEFYRPSIVISKGEIISKASARSVRGFNIIEFIRQSDEFLINAGGHPGAAGFSFETKNLSKLQKKLEQLAEQIIDEKILIKKTRVDFEMDLDLVGEKTFGAISDLSPFGMSNPVPSFFAKNIKVENLKTVGADGKHLKLVLRFGENSSDIISAIGFGMGEMLDKIKIGEKIDIIYIISENIWNNKISYELKIREILN